MFDHNNSTSFKQSVLIDYPVKGSKSIGFITNENCSFNSELSKTAVFVPTTPNPTNGFLIYLDNEDIIYLDIPVEDAIKMVISLGVYGTNKSINKK